MKYEHTREHMLPVIVELNTRTSLAPPADGQGLLELETHQMITATCIRARFARSSEKDRRSTQSVSGFMQYAFPKIHD
jgi:hypothetical protein